MVIHYDLVTEPWIPVQDDRGLPCRVGLRDALVNSPRWQGLFGLSPLTEVAVLRLLLAVLHRALEGPRTIDAAADLLDAGEFPAPAIEAYLERWQHRFDLFHPTHAFYQVPDLPATQPKPWTFLVHERAKGNNPTLFDHTCDDSPPPATPAEAALALLTHQAFVPGGLIKRYGATSGSGGPLATAAVFVPQGKTLFETLVLNLVRYEPAGDLPIWERDPYRLADLEGGQAREPLAGRTRLYTWLSRGIRLLPEGDGTVRHVDYGPGVTPEGSQTELDPMCAYRNANGRLEVAFLREDRAFWRDVDSILPDPDGAHRSPVLEHATRVLYEVGRQGVLFPLAVIGQVTDQAKVLDVRRESYPLSTKALEPAHAAWIRQEVARAAQVGEVLQAAVLTVARILLSPSGRQPDGRQVRSVADSLPGAPVYWARLYDVFPRFLELLTEQGPEQACTYWCVQLRAAVLEAWRRVAEAVGVSAAHAKAVAEGEGRLMRRLGEVLG